VSSPVLRGELDNVRKVAILGTGSWGTALAFHLAHTGHDVSLWGRSAELVSEMKAQRANAVYLPEIVLPPAVVPTASLEEALQRADIVVAAAPSHGTRAVIRSASPYIPRQAVIVSATKGLEQDSLLRISEVIAQEVRGARPIAVLSGPSFAMEVARGLPTAVCVACADPVLAEDVQREFRASYFRLYASTDVAGVEIGGALKNTIAIAAGVVEGMGLGQNALAALITRGLAEITRLACAAGGHRDTLAGLSGLGDLVLTCTGTLSRNRHVGIELGHGRPIAEVVAGMKMVAEGVRTTSVALALGRRHGVELPIATQMAQVLAGSRSAAAAVEELMLRPQKTEQESH
jgi:glycerol-3-phosphate dehydrogenase (NAD(P)+)